MDQAPAARSQELLNSLTHGVGFLLSVVGFLALLFSAARYGDPWYIVSCSIYGTTLVLLYAASTLYHTVRAPRWKRTLRILDHASIYLLIAGSYTPFTLVTLRGGVGWSLFGLVWSLALIGVSFKVFWTGHFEFLSVSTYVLLGWLFVIAIGPLFERLAGGGLLWLLAGGLCYTFGVVFYALDRRPFMHATWHVFVLAGSACHYLAILYHVVPDGVAV